MHGRGMYWRGIHKFMNLQVLPGGNLQGIFGVPGRGGVYYVNGGSDGPTHNDFDGETPLKPKRTITAALALCTDNYNDTIYVLNYGSNARAVETWPIVVNKAQVHIIGIGTKANKWATVTATGVDKDAFSVTAQRVEIAGLEIGGTTGGAGAGVNIANGMWGCYIHDCWFGVADGLGTDGVKVESGAGAPYLRVADNEFGAALTGSGVRIDGNATRGTIENNVFIDVAVTAINITGDVRGIRILNNHIMLVSDSAGYGISLPSGSADCFIDGNVVASQKSATTADNNLQDASTSNAWGLNYSGIVADLPS